MFKSMTLRSMTKFGKIAQINTRTLCYNKPRGPPIDMLSEVAGAKSDTKIDYYVVPGDGIMHDITVPTHFMKEAVMLYQGISEGCSMCESEESSKCHMCLGAKTISKGATNETCPLCHGYGYTRNKHCGHCHGRPFT
jgi:hypothetical protein